MIFHALFLGAGTANDSLYIYIYIYFSFFMYKLTRRSTSLGLPGKVSDQLEVLLTSLRGPQKCVKQSLLSSFRRFRPLLYIFVGSRYTHGGIQRVLSRIPKSLTLLSGRQHSNLVCTAPSKAHLKSGGSECGLVRISHLGPMARFHISYR